MKILVVSGFLGAGKTTFIREFVRRTGRDSAIVENEYGEIGVDGQVLSEGEGLTVREVAEGCICCSAKTDFSASVLTIANTLDPDVLIVEPSGIGLPGNILENLKKIEYERITLLRPVVLIDGKAFFSGLREYPDICRNQIETADQLILTKGEGLDKDALEEIRRAVFEINPDARIIFDDYRSFSDEWFERLLYRPLTGKPDAMQGAAEAPENCGFTGISLPSGYALLLFLEGVVSGVFGNIYRAKGHLMTGGVWLKFDVVDHRYSVTQAEPMPDNRALFIGKHLKRNLLRQALLKQFRSASLRSRAIKKTKGRLNDTTKALTFGQHGDVIM